MPEELATLECLLECRSLTKPLETVQSSEGAIEVDIRLVEVNHWLHAKSEVVRENFCEALAAFKRTVDSAGDG